MTSRDDVKVENQRRLFDDYFRIDAADVDVRRQDGGWTGARRILSLERGEAVSAVVVDAARRIVLMTRQFRFPTWRNGPGWMEELVAGIIDPNEDPETAIAREMTEEIGCAPERLEQIGRFYLSPGGSSERVWLFYAEVDSARPETAGGGLAEEGEVVEIVALPFDDIAPALAAGRFEDAKTIIGLQWLTAQLGGPRP